MPSLLRLSAVGATATTEVATQAATEVATGAATEAATEVDTAAATVEATEAATAEATTAAAAMAEATATVATTTGKICFKYVFISNLLSMWLQKKKTKYEKLDDYLSNFKFTFVSEDIPPTSSLGKQ